MPERRGPITASEAAGAGVLMIAVNLLCTGIGAGVGVLVGAVVPLTLVGFAVGFVLAIRMIVKRFGSL
jgi:hypothetical protein